MTYGAIEMSAIIIIITCHWHVIICIITQTVWLHVQADRMIVGLSASAWICNDHEVPSEPVTIRGHF